MTGKTRMIIHNVESMEGKKDDAGVKGDGDAAANTNKTRLETRSNER